jgi:hypothetical protein
MLIFAQHTAEPKYIGFDSSTILGLFNWNLMFNVFIYVFFMVVLYALINNITLTINKLKIIIFSFQKLIAVYPLP